MILSNIDKAHGTDRGGTVASVSFVLACLLPLEMALSYKCASFHSLCMYFCAFMKEINEERKYEWLCVLKTVLKLSMEWTETEKQMENLFCKWCDPGSVILCFCCFYVVRIWSFQNVLRTILYVGIERNASWDPNQHIRRISKESYDWSNRCWKLTFAITLEMIKLLNIIKGYQFWAVHDPTLYWCLWNGMPASLVPPTILARKFATMDYQLRIGLIKWQSLWTKRSKKANKAIKYWKNYISQRTQSKLQKLQVILKCVQFRPD